MKRIKRTIYALCLLVLFAVYQASVTAFTHVHYVNGSLLRVVENETDTSVIKGKAYRMISLRAPPYSVTL